MRLAGQWLAHAKHLKHAQEFSFIYILFFITSRGIGNGGCRRGRKSCSNRSSRKRQLERQEEGQWLQLEQAAAAKLFSIFTVLRAGFQFLLKSAKDIYSICLFRFVFCVLVCCVCVWEGKNHKKEINRLHAVVVNMPHAACLGQAKAT